MSVPIQDSWIDNIHSLAVHDYAYYGAADPSHVSVYFWAAGAFSEAVASKLIYSQDYTVALINNNRASIVTLTPAGHAKGAAGCLMRIVRIPPFTQPYVYEEQSKFPAKSHENGLDNLEYQIQYLYYLVTKSGTISKGADGEVPQLRWTVTGLEYRYSNTDWTLLAPVGDLIGPQGPPVSPSYSLSEWVSGATPANVEVIRHVLSENVTLAQDVDGTPGPVYIALKVATTAAQTWHIMVDDVEVGSVTVSAGQKNGIASIPVAVNIDAGHVISIQSPGGSDLTASGAAITAKLTRRA